METPVTYAGHTAVQIGTKLLDHLVSVRANPRRLNDDAIYLGRTVDTIHAWISNGRVEIAGESLFFALGLLERMGKIARLPDPASDDVETALCVAFARKAVTPTQVAQILGHDSGSQIFNWIRYGKMTGFSRTRVCWVLSQHGILEWSWLLKMPDHVQRVMAFAALNPKKSLQDLLDMVPETTAGRTAIKSLVANPGTFVNDELRQALRMIVPELPDYIANNAGVNKANRQTSISQPVSVDAHIADLNIQHRIIAAATMLHADLRLLMGGKRDVDVATLVAVIDQLRKGDRTEMLFKLENILGAVNSADEKVICRWLKEEIH